MSVSNTVKNTVAIISVICSFILIVFGTDKTIVRVIFIIGIAITTCLALLSVALT